MTIIQADREAAHKLLGGAAPEGLLTGEQDSLSLVQAFAKHREAAETRAREEGGCKAIVLSLHQSREEAEKEIANVDRR